MPDNALVARAESGIPRGHTRSVLVRQVPAHDSDGKTFFLAWTTTPWTLPGNVALAVHSRKPYVRVVQATSRTSSPGNVFPSSTGLRDRRGMDGSDLVDLNLRALFTDMLPEGLAFVVLDAPEP